MRRRKDIVITMYSRAVIAAGEPFIRRVDTFSDPNVARDEISTLRANAEPLLLRVTLSGVDVDARKLVAGDWLYDAGGASARRLPKPSWPYTGKSLSWSRAQGFWVDAWEKCADARWLISAARVGPVATVLAACACARASLPLASRAGDAPQRAVDAAEGCVRGLVAPRTVTRAAQDVLELSHVAVNVHRSTGWASMAAYYAAQAAINARDRRWVDVMRSNALDCVANVRAAIDASDDPTLNLVGMGELADAVRREISTIDVLRSVAERYAVLGR